MRSSTLEGKKEIPVFLIRADNPQAELLSEVDVDDHVRKLESFVVQQAKAMLAEEGYQGRFLIVRPKESRSNEAMTNNAILHASIWKTIKGKHPISLTTNANFNGYPLKNSCVVVAEGEV